MFNENANAKGKNTCGRSTFYTWYTSFHISEDLFLKQRKKEPLNNIAECHIFVPLELSFTSSITQMLQTIQPKFNLSLPQTKLIKISFHPTNSAIHKPNFITHRILPETPASPPNYPPSAVHIFIQATNSLPPPKLTRP